MDQWTNVVPCVSARIIGVSFCWGSRATSRSLEVSLAEDSSHHTCATLVGIGIGVSISSMPKEEADPKLELACCRNVSYTTYQYIAYKDLYDSPQPGFGTQRLTWGWSTRTFFPSCRGPTLPSWEGSVPSPQTVERGSQEVPNGDDAN